MRVGALWVGRGRLQLKRLTAELMSHAPRGFSGAMLRCAAQALLCRRSSMFNNIMCKHMI